MATCSVIYIILLGTAVSIQSASATLCYKCTPLDTHCKDPFDKNVTTETCQGFCLKMKLGSSDSEIYRSCVVGPYRGISVKCEYITINGYRNHTCTCTTDLCNGVHPIGGSFIGVVMLLVIYFVLF